MTAIINNTVDGFTTVDLYTDKDLMQLNITEFRGEDSTISFRLSFKEESDFQKIRALFQLPTESEMEALKKGAA